MTEAVIGRKQRQESRRAAILHAASEVFFEVGYEGASIDAIIERVGGSKRTIYSEFGSKEGLFAALVTENTTKALGSLPPVAEAGRDLRSALSDFARRLLAVLMEPSVVALYRTVVAEGRRFPELARLFYDNGPVRATARLADILEGYRARGELRVEDCRQAAGLFVGMVRGNLHFEVVLGLRAPPGADEIGRLADAEVGIFLDGIRARR